MLSTIRNLIEARRDKENDEGGFTLIELLIVIVVLGILAAIVVFAVQNLTKDSAATSCRSDAKNVETALEAFKAKTAAYPAPAVAAAAGGFTAIDATNFPNFVGVDKYIRSAPGAAHYVIGLMNPTASTTAAPTATDGRVYIQAPPGGTTAFVELNATGTSADPCKNAT